MQGKIMTKIAKRCFEKVPVQILWNDYRKSKPDSGGN
jgi:hypothetical protein